MKLKSKRSISFPEDGQTPPAWLALTLTLMICYSTIVVLGLLTPDGAQGEPPLLPLLNRTSPIGSTADVAFNTTRACYSAPSTCSQQQAKSWELRAAMSMARLWRD
jgi:hypothetical protein